MGVWQARCVAASGGGLEQAVHGGAEAAALRVIKRVGGVAHRARVCIAVTEGVLASSRRVSSCVSVSRELG